MSYYLGQFNKVAGDGKDGNFMSLLFQERSTGDNAPYVIRKKTKDDVEVTGQGNIIFENEGIYTGNLKSNTNYYFHCQIERTRQIQTFYIKLEYKDSDDKTQYIKTINVAAGTSDSWADVEFIFSPIIDFDCIVFELQRTAVDYPRGRHPKIAYLEFSEINNVISMIDSSMPKLLKIGVQSRPGLIMCINGEEIRVSRTGTFEFKNGKMTIPFFSVVNQTKEATNIVSDWENSVHEQVDRIDPDDPEYNDRMATILSYCFFHTEKQPREIDDFTLDYIYNKDID